MKADTPVSKIMTEKLITVTPEDTLDRILNIFEEHRFHHVPVIEKGSELIGIISKEDILRRITKISHDTTGERFTRIQFLTTEVKEFMTKHPITIDPEDSIGLAADIMLTNVLHALPVVEDGKLAGLVTSHDVLKFALGEIPVSDYEEQNFDE